MAIKTVSQLRKIDNESQGGSTIKQGGIMHYLRNTNYEQYRTDSEEQMERDRNSEAAKIRFNNNCHALDIDNCESSYYNILFEVSKPSSQGRDGTQGVEKTYESFCLTYEDLAKNIILDTKAYLNHRNNLGDFNLCSIVFDTYSFTGSKSFKGDFTIDLSKNEFEVDQSEFLPKKLLWVQNGGVLFDKSDLNFDCNLSTFIYNTLFVQKTGTFSSDIYVETSAWVKDKVMSQYIELTSQGQITTPQLTSTAENFILFTVDRKGIATIHGKLVVDGGIEITGDVSIDGNLGVKGWGHFDKEVTAASFSTDGSIEGRSLHIKEGSKLDGMVQIGKTKGTGAKLIVGDGPGLSGGVIDAGECNLTALNARWGDLAEYYMGDKTYEPGTLVKFGGENEITIADNEANAVITTKPSLVMNCELKDNPLACAIALNGRVPVKVKGKINKFERIMLSDEKGIAVRSDMTCKNIGIALESSDDENVKLIECTVKMEF